MAVEGLRALGKKSLRRIDAAAVSWLLPRRVHHGWGMRGTPFAEALNQIRCAEPICIAKAALSETPEFVNMEHVASVKPRDLPNPSGQIDGLIAGITDWRGETFARVRRIIRAADPEIIEEFKWMGTPVWSRDGVIAVANAFKGRVNVTFANGASLPDPDKLFNAGFEGNARRAINFSETDEINETALKALVLAAIVYNQTHLKKNQKKASAASRKKASTVARARVTKKASTE